MAKPPKRDDAPDLTTIGGRIRFARRLRQITPRQLADTLGLKSAVGVSQWEKNRRTPETPTVVKIAEVLQTTVDWIYRGEGDAPAPITADVPRGTTASDTAPLRGQALIELVKEYGAKVDALRAQGDQQGKIEGMTEGLALAIRHMYMTDPDPDRMARTIAEILLSPDEPDEPPSGPHRLQGTSESHHTNHPNDARKANDPRQQRSYRTA